MLDIYLGRFLICWTDELISIQSSPSKKKIQKFFFFFIRGILTGSLPEYLS